MWHSPHGLHSHANVARCVQVPLNLAGDSHMKIAEQGSRGSVSFENLRPAPPVSFFQNLRVIIQLSFSARVVDTFFETCVSCSQGSLVHAGAFYVQRSCSSLCTLLLADVVFLCVILHYLRSRQQHPWNMSLKSDIIFYTPLYNSIQA